MKRIGLPAEGAFAQNVNPPDKGHFNRIRTPILQRLLKRRSPEKGAMGKKTFKRERSP